MSVEIAEQDIPFSRFNRSMIGIKWVNPPRLPVKKQIFLILAMRQTYTRLFEDVQTPRIDYQSWAGEGDLSIPARDDR
jgi:hypothetical protein